MTPVQQSTCDCREDGYCNRYRREMRGRFRELCGNINVDIGTATAFRAQWAREAGDSAQLARGVTPSPLLLRTDQMPGDAVVMTAAIYSLHKAHPDKYVTAVESKYPEVFAHNPNVVSITSIPDARPLHMHYPAIHQCNECGIHFMQGWCEHLSAVLGIHVPLLTDRPHLYFDHYDHDDPPVGDYWVICSGGKSDFTNKLWGYDNYQEVIDKLSDKVKFIQVGDNHRDHPLLYLHNGSRDMVGRTTLRQLFNLVRRSCGVLCGVSLLMHVAAALDKPCVVIAGGREPVTWNSYPKQTYVHTVGALPCKSVQGHVGRACWRSRVVPLNDGSSFYDQNTCERPVDGLPLCMRLIKPEEIVQIILRYNDYQ